MLPLMVDVKNKQVTIIGGGKVAFRKLSVFLKHGARIKIISPQVTREIENLHEKGHVRWINKEVDKNDLVDAFIVVAATDQRKVNDWVQQEVGDNQLICIADRGGSGSFQMLSYKQTGNLTISVSTNGSSPTLSKRLCEEFFQQCSDEFIEKLDEIGKKRNELIASSLSGREKRLLLKKLADSIRY
ncbi:NAD(P)-dependent oxidoreductase [Bacillus sp. BHET2]|uniref:precorrin-2 dehydrogenase/sirohydrochlorin ferrochelatase family protein n=1 Tax=Bacillus sp. BHET2 TaxID=2583818 RepID=UPI00148691F5|nr:NAD(P)-dependent oxidoreductase [Bacillus sp. BHET2]